MKPVYTRNERLLTIDKLNLDFNGNKILRDVNVHVDDINRPNMAQGQVISLLGPSGIGKTQLFKCIAGLNKPTSGGVYLHKEKKPVEAGEVGFVFQNYPLLNHRTILQNLLIGAKANKKGKDECVALLKLFNLEDKVDHYPSQLSGGQRQRVSIIQQLLCSEHFVLMDEPFSGLDVMAKEKMMDQILKVSTVHEHNTLILTTHDIEAAVSISDTIWVIGRQRDAKGEMIPGATLVKVIDLIDIGLAWNRDVRKHPMFRKVCDDIYNMFETL